MFGRSFTHRRWLPALLAGVLLLGLAGIAIAGGAANDNGDNPGYRPILPPGPPPPPPNGSSEQNLDNLRWLIDHAGDAGDGGAGNPPLLEPAAPMPLGFTGVFRLGTFRVADFQGQTSYVFSAAAMSNMIDEAIAPSDFGDTAPRPRPGQTITSGMTVQLAVPNDAGATTFPAPKPDLYKPLKDSKMGSLMKIELEVLPGQNVGTVVSAEPYKMAPGEDKPGVYVFQRIDTVTLQKVDRPAVVLAKFLQETTLAVTDKKVLAALDNFQTGDSVRITFAGKTLTSIAPYKP